MSDEPDFNNIVDNIVKSYDAHGGINHIEGCILPSQNSVIDILEYLLDIYFPGFFTKEEIHQDQIKSFTLKKVLSLKERITEEISKSLNLCKESEKKFSSQEELRNYANEVAIQFLEDIPNIREVLKTDVEAYYNNDPAAKSHEEVIVSYPGIYAIAVYRSANALYKRNIPLIPRIMTEYAHSKTGIDIHPGATIDEYFFIDHGTGVVIGETTKIGKYCKIYQGVTLGAMTIDFSRDDEGKVVEQSQRHPTLENNVTIYSNATILGGNTVLKEGTIVGGNVFVTSTTEIGDKIVFDSKKGQQKVYKKQ